MPVPSRAGCYLLLLCCAFSASRGSVAEPRLFTVADSIELTRIVGEAGSASLPRLYYSRDRSRAAVVTRRGDLQSGQNTYSLLSFEISEVARWLRDEGSARTHAPRTLAEFTNSSSAPGVSDLVWSPDSQEVAFVGRGANDVAQVYSLNVRSGERRQLTHESLGVISFDLDWEHRRLLYAATQEPDWSQSNRNGYVQTGDVRRLMSLRPGPQEEMAELKILSIGEQPLAVGTEPINRSEIRHASIDPTGRWAALALPAERWRAEWNSYEIVRKYQEDYDAFVCGPKQTCTYGFNEHRGVEPASDELLPMPGENEAIPNWLPQLAFQFALVDLHSGKVKPLLNAPAFAVWKSSPRPLWSRDGRRIILPSTMLPKDDGARRVIGSAPVTAEVDIESGLVTEVVQLPKLATLQHGPFLIPQILSFCTPDELKWLSPDLLTIAIHGCEDTARPDAVRSFNKSRGKWALVATRHDTRKPSLGLELQVEQGLNNPAEVVAVDRATSSKAAVITDLNPQLRLIERGHAELFSWSDESGNRYEAGLVLPPKSMGSAPYPLVIQTHGFSANEFLVDGAGDATSAFAALPLASMGIVVLQVDEDGGVTGDMDQTSRTENPRFIRTIESAIDALASLRIIDRTRVGLIGWSRTGMNVHHFLTFSTYPIAAATVSDATAATPFCYAAVYGEPYLSGGMYEFENSSMKGIGAPPWTTGHALWLERSYFYHLDKIRTPIRYEHLGTSNLPCHWDAFAVLKRMERPTEMVHIPLASHNAREPWGRFASQQGNVDWFDFWLNGREHPAKANATDYGRWRLLRTQLTRIRDKEESQTGVPPLSKPNARARTLPAPGHSD